MKKQVVASSAMLTTPIANLLMSRILGLDTEGRSSGTGFDYC